MAKVLNKETILNAYLACALWTEDFDGKSITDVGASTITQARNDIDSFLEQAKDLISDDWNSEQVGHDLWLTRNGHGSGFWDRGYENGDKLSDIARTFKPLNVWESECDVIYFE